MSIFLIIIATIFSGLIARQLLKTYNLSKFDRTKASPKPARVITIIKTDQSVSNGGDNHN